MKKKQVILLVAALFAMGTLLSGCDTIFGLIFKLPGTWSVTYTWSGYSPGTMSVLFRTDGTFSTSQSQYGTWTQSGLNVNFTYTGPSPADAIYTGKLDFGGTTMSGTMRDPSSSSTGTWTGTLTARALAKSLETGEGGPTGGEAK